MTAKATFAGGCFWQVEADFRNVEGVTATRAGYTGGEVDNPTYELVCTDRTGHAEAVEVEFDPQRVSYEQLLSVFFSAHDPTQLNRQGPDIGTQYRSAIFAHDDEQERTAKEFVEAVRPRYKRAVVTEIVPAAQFWPAEEYHQRYLEKRGLASCTIALQETVERA
ncbi:MAG TPA: peptide-methionine (S)-S-oxide reductase MsrA [Actinomycetota bacterium]|jgi:peptide-methionine (S)-S-oxide reductase|nr:peptide-methionine (S)-S-oxide reductase MsrA [Actinomycetota bacterium]